MKKNKVLIVAERYAPYNGIPAVRPSKITKYLCKNHNCVVDVIKMENDKAIVDDKLAEDTKCVNKTIIISSVEGNKKAKQYKNVLLRKLLSIRILLDDYHNQCKKYQQTKKKLSDVDLNQYNVVFTTYGPLFPHMVGKYVKKHNKNCIWVADYRDPSPNVVHSSSFLLKKLEKNILWNITKTADLITGASPICYEFLDKYKSKPCKVITNGFDEDDFEFRRSSINKKLKVSYTGTIYEGKQELKPFFKSIAKLISEIPEAKDKIELHYAGKQSDIFIEQAKQCSVDDLVIDHKQISRADSIKLQYNSDILLMAVWNDIGDCDILSGKVYEYIGSQIPIVCTVSGNKPKSMIKSIFNDTNIGFCYEFNFEDFECLYQYVHNQYLSFVNTGHTEYNPNKNTLEKYKYKNIVAEFISTIEELKQTEEGKL